MIERVAAGRGREPAVKTATSASSRQRGATQSATKRRSVRCDRFEDSRALVLGDLRAFAQMFSCDRPFLSARRVGHAPSRSLRHARRP